MQTRRFIVERDGEAYLVMDPEGGVSAYKSKDAVLKAVSKDAQQVVAPDGIVVSEVEWRGEKPV